MEIVREELEELLRRLGGEIIDVGRPVKTVSQAVKATNSNPKQIIKSLLFISERGPVLVIVDGVSRIDINKLAKIFGKVSLQRRKRLSK